MQIVYSQAPVPIPFSKQQPVREPAALPAVVIANGVHSMADVNKLRGEAKQYQELKREYLLKANNARSNQPQASSHYMLKVD